MTAMLRSDVECRKPLEEFLQPADAMVAGWEADFPNATYAKIRTYARKRQVRLLTLGML